MISLNYLFGAGQVIPVAHPLLKERQDDVVFVTMVAHVEDLRQKGMKGGVAIITIYIYITIQFNSTKDLIESRRRDVHLHVYIYIIYIYINIIIYPYGSNDLNGNGTQIPRSSVW